MIESLPLLVTFKHSAELLTALNEDTCVTHWNKRGYCEALVFFAFSRPMIKTKKVT